MAAHSSLHETEFLRQLVLAHELDTDTPLLAYTHEYITMFPEYSKNMEVMSHYADILFFMVSVGRRPGASASERRAAEYSQAAFENTLFIAENGIPDGDKVLPKDGCDPKMLILAVNKQYRIHDRLSPVIHYKITGEAPSTEREGYDPNKHLAPFESIVLGVTGRHDTYHDKKNEAIPLLKTMAMNVDKFKAAAPKMEPSGTEFYEFKFSQANTITVAQMMTFQDALIKLASTSQATEQDRKRARLAYSFLIASQRIDVVAHDLDIDLEETGGFSEDSLCGIFERCDDETMRKSINLYRMIMEKLAVLKSVVDRVAAARDAALES